MVDFWIGRLLHKLDALGLRQNTIVIFTSDHGFYFGEHDYFGKAEPGRPQKFIPLRGYSSLFFLVEPILPPMARHTVERLTESPVMVSM